jgi:molybdate transport system substrate-binding protein
VGKRCILTFFGGILIILLLPWAWRHELMTSPGTAKVNITISATISLKESLQKIKLLYQQKQPNVELTYNFGSSGSLQQQIEQGAPVDIFISAAVKQMDALQSKQLLLDKTRHTLLKNQLALITPLNELSVNQFSDLTGSKIGKIALGEPKSVPAGQYGEEVLKYYQLLDSIKPKIIYTKDVRQVLNYVETGNVNAGLVYISDAKTSNKVRIVTIALPNSHSPIIYPIAILKGSKKPDLARAFVQFLSSKPAQEVFKNYGFSS